MHDFPLQTAPAEQPAECLIDDEYIIYHKDATVIRKIVYKNISEKPFPLNLESYPITYPSSCEDFSLKINSEDVSYKIEEHPYSQTIFSKKNYEIPPREKLEIVIKCKWKKFSNFIDDCSFIISYSEKAQYELKISQIYLKDRLYVFTMSGKILEKDRDFIVTENAVHFKKVDLDSNKLLKIELLMLYTPKELPTFSYFSKSADNKFSQ
jgi:hypothetical protein